MCVGGQRWGDGVIVTGSAVSRKYNNSQIQNQNVCGYPNGHGWGIRGWGDFYWGLLGTCKRELPWVKQVGKRKGGYRYRPKENW